MSSGVAFRFTLYQLTRRIFDSGVIPDHVEVCVSMDLIRNVFREIFFALPAIVGLLFTAAALAVIYMDELQARLKDQRIVRWIVAIVLLVMGIGAFISDKVQKNLEEQKLTAAIESTAVRVATTCGDKLLAFIKSPAFGEILHEELAKEEMGADPTGAVSAAVDRAVSRALAASLAPKANNLEAADPVVISQDTYPSTYTNSQLLDEANYVIGELRRIETLYSTYSNSFNSLPPTEKIKLRENFNTNLSEVASYYGQIRRDDARLVKSMSYRMHMTSPPPPVPPALQGERPFSIQDVNADKVYLENLANRLRSQ